VRVNVVNLVNVLRATLARAHACEYGQETFTTFVRFTLGEAQR
jgi:hypothetical protein